MEFKMEFKMELECARTGTLRMLPSQVNFDYG